MCFLLVLTIIITEKLILRVAYRTGCHGAAKYHQKSVEYGITFADFLPGSGQDTRVYALRGAYLQGVQRYIDIDMLSLG
jgi:hypothetical protein